MKLVRGTNVYPRAVEALIREHAEVDEFQIRLYTADGIRDEIEVLIEVPDADVDVDALCARAVEASWPTRTSRLRFGVRSVELGSLPRFELKAKRVMRRTDRDRDRGRAEEPCDDAEHGGRRARARPRPSWSTSTASCTGCWRCTATSCRRSRVRNATKALAALWQVMNGLDMDPGQLYDVGA